MKEDEEVLAREEIWLRHGGHSIHALYGDDGEMQCNSCMIDFKRDSITSIITRLADLRRAAFAKAHPALPPSLPSPE